MDDASRLIFFPTDAADRSHLGGKAAALADLAESGLPIPPWFAVSSSAFHESLTAEQSQQLAAETDPASVRRIVEHVRPSSGVVRAVEEAVARLGAASLAVRSSAVDEDGSSHSFAGQLESFLFVSPENVVDRIAAVWRSGFAERVIQYRLERGMSAPAVAPAVLVQAMIDGRVAGVAFGADPITGSRSTVLISAVYGLGTALVGGDADADTYRVSAFGEIVESNVASKTTRHVRDPGSPTGVREEPVDRERAVLPALDGASVLRVKDLVLACARHFNRPQDIEWASAADGKLYLLQARPITSLANLPDPDGVRAIWDNSNIAESYAGITTPLTFTFARLAYEGVYREFCRMMKVSPRVIADNDAMFSQMLGMIRGRVYYNLLNWYRLLAMLPGYSVNGKFMEQMMGVKEGLPPDALVAEATPTRRQRHAARLRLAWSAAGLAWNHFVLGRKIKAFYVRLNDALKPPEPPLAHMRLDQLTAEFRRLESRLLSRWDAPLINDFLAMIFFGVLGKLSAKWCGGGDNCANVQNDLITDEGGIISAEPAQRIERMGRMAATDGELTDLLCEGHRRDAEARLMNVPDLNSMFRGYLDKFGDRCLEELKLESPTLTDDPTPLLRAVGHSARRLRSGEPPREKYDPRRQAEALVASRLRGRFIRRIVFNWVLRNARRRVRDRENLRFERTRLFGRIRSIFVEAGKRLYGEGFLDGPRDVFYLTIEEILSFVEGTGTIDDLHGLARLRKDRFRTYAVEPAPADRFETRGPVYAGNAFTAASKDDGTAPSDGEFKGTGCCPGIVRGPVRVIRDPRGAQLHHGEILVAERTDPGWIMLFPAAAGVLVERGSLLSHSAIVARELGIPAIVSIAGITTGLANGQWVEMNGATGTIKRIEPGS